jgi:hypothetical protein
MELFESDYDALNRVEKTQQPRMELSQKPTGL